MIWDVLLFLMSSGFARLEREGRCWVRVDASLW